MHRRCGCCERAVCCHCIQRTASKRRLINNGEKECSTKIPLRAHCLALSPPRLSLVVYFLLARIRMFPMMLTKCPVILLYSFRIFSISIYLLDPFLIDDECPVWVAANVAIGQEYAKLSPSCRRRVSIFARTKHHIEWFLFRFGRPEIKRRVRINDKWCAAILLWHAFRSRLIFEIVCLFHSIRFCFVAYFCFSTDANDLSASSHEYYYYSFIYQRRSIDSHISAQCNLVICFRMPSTRTKIKYTPLALRYVIVSNPFGK